MMVKFVRIEFAIFLAILSQVECHKSSKSSSNGSKSRDGSKQPNIVVVLTEMGYKDLGIYNSDVMTPNIDGLARTGVIMDKYYTKAHSTPIRSQIMTGKHQNTLGLQTDIIRPDTGYGMPLGVPTLANKLGDEGYATHYLGKWHLGHFRREYTPTYRGFDTFYGFYNGIIEYYNHSLPCPANFSDWGFDMWDNQGDDLRPVRPQDMVGRYNNFLFRNRALRIIDRHDKKKPLFMTVSAYEVKENGADTPQVYLDLYKHRQDVDIGLRQRWAKATIVDDMVGALVDSLKYNQMWEKTVFVFTSDKGLRYPGKGINKDIMFKFKFPAPVKFGEADMKTFNIFHSPLFSADRQGAHVADYFHSCDIFPTLLRAAGVKGADRGEGNYGVDMWPTISAGVPGPRTSMLHFIEHSRTLTGVPLYTDTFDTRIKASYMDGDFKINTGPKSGPGPKNYWLYNITNDPAELHDLSDDPAHTPRLRALLATLQDWNLRSAPALHLLPTSQPDPAACPRHHGGYFAPWK